MNFNQSASRVGNPRLLLETGLKARLSDARRYDSIAPRFGPDIMPLFQITHDKFSPVAQSDFSDERTLQNLIERNLGTVFNSRLVATEFSTGAQHAGRIDTLALSEDGNPVIIEYKRVASSELINQGLFYLAWLHDHHGDFEIAVQKALGPSVGIDWSDTRVICLAPNYKRYDLLAVQMMGVNIELWTYRLFANGSIYLEEILQKAVPHSTSETGKNPIMVAAGKKAAATKATATWTFEKHVEGKPEQIKSLVLALQEFMLGLDASLEESPKKYYIAYRTTQNIASVETQQKKVLLFLKLDPKIVSGPPGISRDVSKIGHFGTGDLEITLKTPGDLEVAKPFITRAYETIGG